MGVGEGFGRTDAGRVSASVCRGVWLGVALVSSSPFHWRRAGPCAVSMLAISEREKVGSRLDHLVVF